MQLSRWIRLALGVGVTAAFLWLAMRRVDFSEVVRVGKRIPWVTYMFALTLLAIEYGIRSVRWWKMLQSCGERVPLSSCVWPLLVSVGVNNIVPFRAGDALRIVGFRKQLRASAMGVLGTVIVERLLDVTILLLFLLAGLAWLEDGAVSPLYIQVATLVSVLTLLFWTTILAGTKPILGVFRWRILRSHRVVIAVEQPARQLMAALNVVRTPGQVLGLLGLSLLVWFCDGAIFATVASALGYTGRMFGPWFSLATATLSTLIPSSPGYVGTFDFFSMAGLSAYGATRTVSVAFALVLHTILWVPLTLVGLSYFLLPVLKGSHWRAERVATRGREQT